MNTKRSKKKNQIQHAKHRAMQRYGISLTASGSEEMVRKIQSQKDCVFLERQSNRVSMIAVLHEEVWIPVVYDKQRKSIVTVLPENALQPYRSKLPKN